MSRSHNTLQTADINCLGILQVSTNTGNEFFMSEMVILWTSRDSGNWGKVIPGSEKAEQEAERKSKQEVQKVHLSLA